MCLGMPARLVDAVNIARQSVLVDVWGQEQQVSAAMLMDEAAGLPQPGDWVLVHMGFALSRMDESEASSVLGSLDDLSDLYADQLPAHASESEPPSSAAVC